MDYYDLVKTFSRRTVSIKKAKELEGKPKEIANWVYGLSPWATKGAIRMMAGTIAALAIYNSRDAYNFKLRGKEIGIDLENNPRLARDPVIGFQTASGLLESNQTESHSRQR